MTTAHRGWLLAHTPTGWFATRAGERMLVGWSHEGLSEELVGRFRRIVDERVDGAPPRAW